MAAAVVSVGVVLVLALIGGVWHLAGRLARIEAKVDGLPTAEKLIESIRIHQEHCPAYQDMELTGKGREPTGGHILPIPHGPVVPAK